MELTTPAVELVHNPCISDAWVHQGSNGLASTVSIESITRRRKRRWLRGWLIWPLLAVLGAGGWYYYQGQTATTVAPQYATTAAATGAITVKISAIGTVQPIDEVNVSSTISGIVSAVNVQINDKVIKGDLLASLDTSALEAELARDKATLTSQEAKLADATATVDDATIALTRAQTLTTKGLAAQDTLTTAQTAKRRADAGLASARADIEVAKADILLSQSNLDKARIYAPMDGMVLDRNVEVGQTVSASTAAVTLFQLAHDLGQMQLQVDVDEADIGKVAVGNAASFTVDAYQGQTFPATVSALHFAPQTVDGVVTYRTLLTIDNSDLKLRPGMTASADITVEQVQDALEVPNAAFRYSPPVVTATQRRSGLLGMIFPAQGPRQTTTVTNALTKEGYRKLYVLKDGTATEVSVKTGVTDGTMTEVLDGTLAAGDLVITGTKAAK